MAHLVSLIAWHGCLVPLAPQFCLARGGFQVLVAWLEAPMQACWELLRASLSPPLPLPLGLSAPAHQLSLPLSQSKAVSVWGRLCSVDIGI